MSLKKVIAVATIPAMVASPVAAAGNPAASLSLRGDSSESADAIAAAAPAEIGQPGAAYAGGSGLSSPLIIGGLAVLLVVIGAVALGSGHHGMHSASA